MVRMVSASEAKNRFGALLDEVSNGEHVIVTYHGKPEVAFVPIADYEELQSLRRSRDQAEALQRLDNLEQEIRARNQDMSEEDSIAMAVRLSRELFQDYIDRQRGDSEHAHRRSA